jgi:hypothetical protein
VKTPTTRRTRGEAASTASAAVTTTSANADTNGWASAPVTSTESDGSPSVATRTCAQVRDAAKKASPPAASVPSTTGA